MIGYWLFMAMVCVAVTAMMLAVASDDGSSAVPDSPGAVGRRPLDDPVRASASAPAAETVGADAPTGEQRSAKG